MRRPSHLLKGPRVIISSTASGVSFSVIIDPSRWSFGGMLGSRSDHYLAQDLPVLNQPQAFDCLIERKNLVDNRLEFLLRNQAHQIGKIVVVEAVRTDDLQFETPDVAQVFLWIVSGGSAANEQLASALQTAQRGNPGVAAGEVHNDIDAAVIVAALRLSVFFDRPLREVDILVIDDM